MRDDGVPMRRIFLGIALTSLSTLLLQVTFIRLFSVALWHHFAFMVVSIAFLGFGASGSFLMLRPQMMTLSMRPAAACLTIALSVGVLVSYIMSNMIPFDPARMAWDRYQFLYLSIYYLVLSIPFFFSGLCLSLIYYKRYEAVNRLYAADLFGAGLGCVGVLVVFSPAGEAGAIILVALVPTLASFAFDSSRMRWNIIRGLWVLTLVVFYFVRPQFLQLQISPYKGLMVALRYPGARVLETRWGPSARLDVIKSGAVRFAPGLSLRFTGELPHQLGICIDADRLNAVTRFQNNPESTSFAGFLPASIPYCIVEPKDVLLVEPSGGLDVLIARHHNAQRVLSIVSNPLVVQVMRTSLREYSGDLYGQPGSVAEENVRSFLKKTERMFDIIQLSPIDTLGAISSGLYALAEDYTFTVEAFHSYIRALKKGGVLTVTRYLLPPPRYEIRLVGLALAALEEMGAPFPERHIVAIRSWGTFTMLVKRSPFDIKDIDRIKDFCHRLRFDLVYYPGMKRAEANIFNRFSRPLYYDLIEMIIDKEERDRFYRNYLFAVNPVRDENPFFYHSFKLNKLRQIYRAVGEKWQIFIEGGYLIYLILLQALTLGLVCIALPVKRMGLRYTHWFMIYFGLIGLGFILVEISLIQRFILFLDRPIHAFITVLFSCLSASAAGSLLSRHLRRPLLLVACAPVLIAVYALYLGEVLNPLMVCSFGLRQVLAFLSIFPLGLVMGMFFPLGIRELGTLYTVKIPWAWAVNSCASVVGSVLSVIFALSLGFKNVLLIASLLYLMAVFCLSIKVTGQGVRD